jgi:hypothetical protein
MRLLATLVVSSPLMAQAVSLGVRAGIPITPLLTADGRYEASAPRYAIGALIEVDLWQGAALGADFLLRRAELAISPLESRAGLWRWEVPVAFLYRFRAPARPFVRIGGSVNRMFAISGATECGRGPLGEHFYCLEGNPLAELRHRGTLGLVAGGGLRFKLNKLSLEPEVRLTRWMDRNFGVRDSEVRSNLNQVDVLFGVVF